MKLKDYLPYNKNAGILEYVFATTAVISALPSVLIYFFIVFLIQKPVKALVNKVWK